MLQIRVVAMHGWLHSIGPAALAFLFCLVAWWQRCCLLCVLSAVW